MPLILVVDDDEAVAQTIAACLHQDGHEVLVSNDGNEALDLAERNPIDLFVLDVMMPDLSGLDVLHFIRNYPAVEKTPVVVVSAKALPKDIKLGIDAGASVYLTKPVAYLELKGAVEEAIKSTEKKGIGI